MSWPTVSKHWLTVSFRRLDNVCLTYLMSGLVRRQNTGYVTERKAPKPNTAINGLVWKKTLKRTLIKQRHQCFDSKRLYNIIKILIVQKKKHKRVKMNLNQTQSSIARAFIKTEEKEYNWVNDRIISFRIRFYISNEIYVKNKNM